MEPPHTKPPTPDHAGPLDALLSPLKRRLIRQATLATGMLELALESLWAQDIGLAGEVRGRDDRVDDEEIALEEKCNEILALHQPVARDFRVIVFILKTNHDVERLADHATSIAKIGAKITKSGNAPEWPTALKELGERVPMLCHTLLRAVLDEDEALAREVVASDETIDRLDKRLTKEAVELIRAEPEQAENGLHIARLGRELERIGDIMTNIGEDIVYLQTGEIVRHGRG